jgi:hypothetical protein
MSIEKVLSELFYGYFSGSLNHLLVTSEVNLAKVVFKFQEVVAVGLDLRLSAFLRNFPSNFIIRIS